MFTTPTKATSRLAPATNSPATFRMRRGPLFASPSPYSGPGGFNVMSPPTLASIVNSSPSPFATPLRRRYTPTRFQSPPSRTPKSHRGRVPTQSVPRKERSFQSLGKPIVTPAPVPNDNPSFSELSDKVHAASAKSKIPAGTEADIFFVQLGKLDSIRSLTKELMKTHISTADASPVPDFEAARKARRERRYADVKPKATKTPELDSPQKREALFASQRKKLREEALHRDEQQREFEDRVAGFSEERTRLSPDSDNKLKRKQQEHKAGDGDSLARERAKAILQEQERAARQLLEEEAARRQADRAAKQRIDEEAARLRAEAEFAERRKREEVEHQEHLARIRAQAALEEEQARQRAAEEEIQRRVAEEVRKKAVEEEARRKAIADEARREAEEKAQRIAREEEVARQAEAHAKWRLQEQRERQEHLERLARQQAQEEARIKAEHARIQAEHARRVAEELAQQARIEVEQARRLAEEQARIHAEQKARLLAEEEAQRQAAYERAQALAAEEARIRAVAEAVAQMQAELNARAQAAFGGGASWHNPHEFYEFNRFQQQRQQQDQQHHHQQQQQHHHQQQQQQQQPSPEFQHTHQQPFFEQPQQQQQHYYQSHQHDYDIPMREPSLADINMDGPGGSTPYHTAPEPNPEPTPAPSPPPPSPPPPPPPPPAPLTKEERIKAYWSRWAIPTEESPLPINFSQIPWPVCVEVQGPEDITVERLCEFYTDVNSRKMQKDFRKLAQSELKKWHSDKLSQRFRGNFDGSEAMIIATANEITRFLIQVLMPMKTK